jgi:hypothetical protein
MDSNDFVTVKPANRPTPKPKPVSLPDEQLEIEPIEQPEIEQPEQPTPVVLESLAEPPRNESVYGSGWNVNELLDEFNGRYNG